MLSNGTIRSIHSNTLFLTFELAVEDDYIRKNLCVGCLKEYSHKMLRIRAALTIDEQYIKTYNMLQYDRRGC